MTTTFIVNCIQIPNYGDIYLAVNSYTIIIILILATSEKNSDLKVQAWNQCVLEDNNKL